MRPASSRIGKYEIKRRLGGGGMAEVFVAQLIGAEGFARDVAIKRVLPGHAQNPAFAKMFVTEARLLATLNHPNIVAVLDFDHDPQGDLFLVMELIDGRDLDQLMATGLLPLSVVIYIVVELLRGLGHAHHAPVHGARGVVHRDVSPHNVLLSWEGAIKVSDFGLAKARASPNETLGGLKGKPAYMSPEQANGQPLDGRSDLFSVGVVLWEMLVGQPLFSAATAQETLAMVMFSQIPSPAKLRKDLPTDLAAVTMRLLEREVHLRTATAAHAIHELMACREVPRDGRAELIKLMSDRFSNAAPTLAAAATDSEPAPSILEPPDADLPELRKQMRQAQARSAHAAQPIRRGRDLRWIVVVGVLIGAVVMTLVAITLMSHRSATSGRPARDANSSPPAGANVLPPSHGADVPQRDATTRDATEPVMQAHPQMDKRNRNTKPRAEAKNRTTPTNGAPPADASPVKAPDLAPESLDRDGDGIPDIR